MTFVHSLLKNLCILYYEYSWVQSCVPVLQTLLMLTTEDFMIHRCMCVCMLIINVYLLSMNWFDVHTLRACNSPFLLSRTLFFLTQLCLYTSTHMLSFAFAKVCILFKWQVYLPASYLHMYILSQLLMHMNKHTWLGHIWCCYFWFVCTCVFIQERRKHWLFMFTVDQISLQYLINGRV